MAFRTYLSILGYPTRRTISYAVQAVPQLTQANERRLLKAMKYVYAG